MDSPKFFRRERTPRHSRRGRDRAGAGKLRWLASESAQRLSEFLSCFDSESLRVVFDPGNPIGHGASVEETWALYRAALPYIVHFHIKDCRRLPDGGVLHVMPGDGECDVAQIIRDILRRGYSGMFSIEPHLEVSSHGGNISFGGNNLRENYLKYGLRAKGILEELGFKEIALSSIRFSSSIRHRG